MRYRRPESVLVIVADGDGEVLLLRRRDPVDYWQSVTGSLEWGEAPLAAARRELREEIGVDGKPAETGLVNDFEIVPPWTEKFAPDTTMNREYVYLLQLRERPEVELDGGEHVEYRWLRPRDAVLLAASSTNRDAIRQLLKS